jgi:protease I
MEEHDMAANLQGKRIALVATDGVEQIELERPRAAVEDAGGDVELVSIDGGEFQGFEHLDKGKTFIADTAAADADPSAFDALLLPGGVANPDRLRTDDDVVGFIRSFFDDGKPVAVICHGPWTLVEADVIRDRTLTSWPSLRTDIANAGGEWVDQEVVVDGDLVSSRKPDDLDAFCDALVEVFAKAAARAG